LDPIEFYNRYTGELETEKVYGEGFLNWTYNNPIGKIPLHLFVKKPFFSKWYGRRMDKISSANKIPAFLQDYDMNVDEFLDPVDSYKTFNEFFYRKLKSEARPISESDIIFPADGRHLGFEKASEIRSFFVKGQKFDLKNFLDDDTLFKKFQHGSLVLSRLCPVDYHRFHFPVSGNPQKCRLINGPLFSVSPLALRKNLSYLWQNKRAITQIDTEDFGSVLAVEIGATCVGSIHQTYLADKPINKGDEKGYFSFGGSSTITIFEPGRVKLSKDLLENTAIQRELYAYMGDTLGNTS